MELSMDENVVSSILEYCDDKLVHVVLSNSRCPEELKKVTLRPVSIGGRLQFQSCEHRGTKVFHENHTVEGLADKLTEWLEKYMKQAEIQSLRGTAQILISKKGHATIKKKAAAKGEGDGALPELSHNRAKSYILA